MKKMILAVLALAVGGTVSSAWAGEHPLLGCLRCRATNVGGWVGGVVPHHGHYGHGPLMTGNCGFGPCGGGCVPGPWYTYWAGHGQHNFTSPYQTPGWTYLHHFQTPAPIAAAAWAAPDAPGGFGGVPYYWSGR